MMTKQQDIIKLMMIQLIPRHWTTSELIWCDALCLFFSTILPIYGRLVM